MSLLLNMSITVQHFPLSNDGTSKVFRLLFHILVPSLCDILITIVSDIRMAAMLE
jgi:hypothetical protein